MYVSVCVFNDARKVMEPTGVLAVTGLTKHIREGKACAIVWVSVCVC